MANIQPYDNDYVYDETRGIYIARHPLSGERAIKAIEKAGLVLRLFNNNKFVTPPNNAEDLERLMECLDKESLPEILRNKKSRVLTFDEYDEMMNWAEVNDVQLYKSAEDYFEVLNGGKKYGYVVNMLDAPAERNRPFALTDYPISNNNVGITVREVLE